MKFFTQITIYISLFVMINTSFFCGSNPIEEGQKAYDKADYKLALKYFSEARKDQPENQAIKEKMALSYMMHGKNLYEKTRNIKTFYGNFTRGEEFVPDVPSEEFQTEYSNLLFDLARAYISAKPENEIQKEEYLNKSISSLENSLGYNPENKPAEDLLNKIKADNFSSMLEKGKSLFAQAKKQRNNDLYFAAEYYFIKANNFDPQNKEAEQYLSKTRAQTLDVPDIQQDLALAIGDHSYTKGCYLMYVEMQNNTPESIEVRLDNFNLFDKDGNMYSIDKEMMAKLKKDTVMPEKQLSDRKSNGGIIAFKMAKKKDIDYLAYQLSESKTVKKYFP